MSLCASVSASYYCRCILSAVFSAFHTTSVSHMKIMHTYTYVKYLITFTLCIMNIHRKHLNIHGENFDSGGRVEVVGLITGSCTQEEVSLRKKDNSKLPSMLPSGCECCTSAVHLSYIYKAPICIHTEMERDI